MKHTTTPWKQKEILSQGITIMTEDEKYVICHMRWHDGLNPKVTEAIGADAEFITRACNSHYELVEMCEKIIELVGEPHPEVFWVEELKATLARLK